MAATKGHAKRRMHAYAQCHDAMHLLTFVYLLGRRLQAVGLVSIARLVSRDHVRGHEDVPQRPAMLHRARRAVLLEVECTPNGCPSGLGLSSPCTHHAANKKCHM